MSPTKVPTPKPSNTPSRHKTMKAPQPRAPNMRWVLLTVIAMLVIVCMGLMAYQVYTMRIKMANMEASTEMRFLNELSQELPAIKDEAMRCMGKTKRELMSHMATLHQSVESQLSTLEARVPDDLPICEGPSVSEIPSEPAGGQGERSSGSDTEE